MLNKETWTHKKILLQPLRFSWKEDTEVLKGDHRDFQIHFPLQHTQEMRLISGREGSRHRPIAVKETSPQLAWKRVWSKGTPS